MVGRILSCEHCVLDAFISASFLYFTEINNFFTFVSMPILLTDFRDLQDKYYGMQGTLERKQYEATYRNQINKIRLERMVKKIKANAKR